MLRPIKSLYLTMKSCFKVFVMQIATRAYANLFLEYAGLELTILALDHTLSKRMGANVTEFKGQRYDGVPNIQLKKSGQSSGLS